jgi:hypothetical protein
VQPDLLWKQVIADLVARYALLIDAQDVTDLLGCMTVGAARRSAHVRSLA